MTVLLAEYASVREDERVFNATQATLISVTVGLIGLGGGLLTQVCALAAPSATTPSAAAAAGCTIVAEPLLAASPLPALALLAYIAAHGSIATSRSYYVRALEREIRGLLPPSKRGLKSYPGLPLASSGELATSEMTLSRGASQFRQLIAMVFLCLLGIFGGTTLYIAVHLSVTWLLVMFGLYGLGTGVLINSMWDATVRGRRRFDDSVEALRHRLENPLKRPTGSARVNERSLGAYLTLPRPEDLIKAPFLPLAFLISTVATHSNWRSTTAATIVIWVVLELLIYQARYQWNDVRGIDEDTSDPKRRERRRLPVAGGARRAVQASFLIAGLRLYVTLAIAYVPLEVRGVRIGWVILALSIAVFLLAIAYESLRAVSSAGHGGSLSSWMLYGLVGGGYMVRGLAGLWLGDADGRLPFLSYALFGTFLAAFGSVFVVITWAFHGFSFCLDDLMGPRTRYLVALDQRPHLRYLVEASGVTLVGAATLDVDEAETLGSQAFALERRGKLATPWNWFVLEAGLLAGAAGVALVYPSAPIEVWLTATFASLAGAAFLALSNSSRGRVVGYVSVLFMAAVVLARMNWPRGASGYLGLIPSLALAVIVVAFRRGNYSLMKNLPDRVAARLRVATGTFAVILVGRTTASTLQRDTGTVDAQVVESRK